MISSFKRLTIALLGITKKNKQNKYENIKAMKGANEIRQFPVVHLNSTTSSVEPYMYTLALTTNAVKPIMKKMAE